MMLSCANPNDIPLKNISIAIELIWYLDAFGADCQKHYTLKYKRGLITEGF